MFETVDVEFLKSMFVVVKCCIDVLVYNCSSHRNEHNTISSSYTYTTQAIRILLPNIVCVYSVSLNLSMLR